MIVRPPERSTMSFWGGGRAYFWAGHYLRYLAQSWGRDHSAKNGLKDRPRVNIRTPHANAESLFLQALHLSAESLHHLIAKRYWRQAAVAACLLLLMGTGPNGSAQGSVAQVEAPFGVSNRQNKKWPTDEATRIYFSACDRVARTIRPLNPPRLRPNFVLVLGAQNNETVRDGRVSEVRLKNWDPAAFAQAVVILAAREILSADDMTHITREALTYARSSVSVSDLRQEQ